MKFLKNAHGALTTLMAVVLVAVVGAVVLHSVNADIPTFAQNTDNDALEVKLKKSDSALVANNYGRAPELNNTTWLNVEKPLKLKDLRGQVVLLEFWTFGCYNCKNTLPAMKAWYDKYADKGLVIIGNHFPEFGYESEVDNVKTFLKVENIKYAVPIDNDGATWRAYKQHFWPTIYLIDKRGDIRYVAIGEHDYSRTEAAIKALLSE